MNLTNQTETARHLTSATAPALPQDANAPSTQPGASSTSDPATPPALSPAWKSAIRPHEAHELFHLLSIMHGLSLLDGIAPTREHFRRVARVTDKAYLKFFPDYTEMVYACGYSLSKVKKITEARARHAAVRGMMNREFTPRPTRPPAPTGHENLFGERIEGYELLHAPVNEQGVVVLFAMMAKKLGFLIELVRQGYPDCEAKRRGPDDKWRRVRIEFEYCTSRFNHDPAGCDLVVCWVNDSRKCQVEVLELKSEIARLAQASAESASGVNKRSGRAARASERSESSTSRNARAADTPE